MNDKTYCKDCGTETKSGSGSARCPSCWDDRFGAVNIDRYNLYSLTPAGKLEVMRELFFPTIDEDGVEHPPIIELTNEEMIEILNKRNDEKKEDA